MKIKQTYTENTQRGWARSSLQSVGIVDFFGVAYVGNAFQLLPAYAVRLLRCTGVYGCYPWPSLVASTRVAKDRVRAGFRNMTDFPLQAIVLVGSFVDQDGVSRDSSSV